MVEVGVNIGTFPTHKRELIPKSDLEIIPVSCYGNAPDQVWTVVYKQYFKLV